jgi:hypothetical protein
MAGPQVYTIILHYVMMSCIRIKHPSPLPALWQVRKAFCADTTEGKTLIVADYGQLELRILAHMAACKSMITAFVLGGDFHSRTAYGMYDYIQEDVKKGELSNVGYTVALMLCVILQILHFSKAGFHWGLAAYLGGGCARST